MFFEEPEHAARTVAELIGVFACIEIAIGAAEIGTDAIANALRVMVFAGTVAPHRQDIEVHHVIVTEAVPVLGREIAVDAAPDTIPLGPHANRFGDFDPAILDDHNVAMKIEYAFLARRRQRQQEQAGEQASHSTDPNLTSGTLAASSDDFWKKLRARKLNIPAIILLGTDSVIVLYSRTDPL